MKTEVRSLNERGEEAFREYLADLRTGLIGPPPAEILSDEQYTQEIDGAATVEARDFGSRMDAPSDGLATGRVGGFVQPTKTRSRWCSRKRSSGANLSGMRIFRPSYAAKLMRIDFSEKKSLK